jgi:hypothetical protein
MQMSWRIKINKNIIFCIRIRIHAQAFLNTDFVYSKKFYPTKIMIVFMAMVFQSKYCRLNDNFPALAQCMNAAGLRQKVN